LSVKSSFQDIRLYIILRLNAIFYNNISIISIILVDELRRELSDNEVNEEVEIANEHSMDNYFVATESQSSESQLSTESTSGAGISK
jgi:hypothetical protein